MSETDINWIIGLLSIMVLGMIAPYMYFLIIVLWRVTCELL